MKYKKGYFKLEQSLITGGIVILALFIFFKILNPFPITEVEQKQLTGFEIGQYITNMEKDNRENAITIAKQYEDLVYWSNVDQAEEIKKLKKRPPISFVILLGMVWIIFMILFFLMLDKKNDKEYKINGLEIQLANIKVELYSKNKKKITAMKEIFERE